MPSEFSCEHCGKPETREAERQCDHCGCGMCSRCTADHDDADRCPAEQRPPVSLAEGDWRSLTLAGKGET